MTAVYTNISNFDGALKQLYLGKLWNNLVFKNRPLLGMLKKFEDFGGRNLPVPIEYGGPAGGRSATFTTAQSNATQVLVDEFLVTRVSDYQVAYITGEGVEATRGDKHAFVSALKSKIDGSIRSLSNSVETFLFRSGAGSIGQVGSVSSGSLTLKQIEEITNFEVGMTLVSVDEAAETGAMQDSGATEKIAGVNRSTGVLTATSTNWTDTLASVDADDYLMVSGDAQNGGSSATKITGLAGWIRTSPATVFGVDQSTDTRLAGIYYDGSDLSLEEGAIQAQSRCATNEGAPDKYLIHNAQYRRLILELGSKKEYNRVNARDKKGTVADIGYDAIVVQGDYGPIDIVACNKAQANIGWMLDMDTWTLATLGKVVKPLNKEDGLTMLRVSNADGFESRWVFRGNLLTNFPIANAHVALPNP